MLARLPLAIAGLFLVAFVGLPFGAMLWQTLDTPEGIGFSAFGAILSSPVDRAQLLASIQLGLAATGISCLLGFGHAFSTYRTDLPLARVLGPLGVAPLVIPPILVAMGFADLADVSGFWACSFLLGVSYAPFVAVLTGRALRSTDGRLYEAAWLARGRPAAERMLVRSALPEILSGCLLAFIFVVSEHGVPEFLTVKGKTWHTYAEGIFARWTRRATGVSHEDLVGPIVAAVPLVAIILIALLVALRLRARTSIRGEFQPLPRRRLGKLRGPALLVEAIYLGAGVFVPLLVMGRWAAGSTQVNQPMSLQVLRASFHGAFTEAGGDLAYTVGIAVATSVLVLVVAMPLAHLAARRLGLLDGLCVLPVAVPAILLGIGMVHVYNSPLAARAYAHTFDFYDSWGVVAAAYAARFLPFGVLTLSHAIRRIPVGLEEAAALSGRSGVARAVFVHLPLLLPAAASAACLVFVLGLRELDLAVVLPAGNGTVVRRLSNVVHFGGENTGGALALLLLLAAVLVPLSVVLVTGRRLRPLS